MSPEANSISAISGLAGLFKFNLNFEEEESKTKLSKNSYINSTQFIYTLYTSRGPTANLRTTALPTFGMNMIGTKGAGQKINRTVQHPYAKKQLE